MNQRGESPMESNQEADRLQEREMKIRSILRQRFPDEPLLLHVRAVGEIIGIPYSILQRQIKKDIFFMPCRVLGGTPMVDAEEFARWYASDANVNLPEAFREKEQLPEDLDERKQFFKDRMTPAQKFMKSEISEIEKDNAGWFRKSKGAPR
jgi:hypothetical protein